MLNNTLVFVYNADSGFFNTLADIGHKIVSPGTYECKLCALTHDVFAVKKVWQGFVASHPGVAWRFYHRDEFNRVYPDVGEALPAVFLETDDGIRTIISKGQLEALEDVQGLMALVELAVGEVGDTG